MAEMGHWLTARNKRHRMHFLMWKWRRLTVNIIILLGLYWLTVNCLWHCILFYFNCILFMIFFKKSKTIQLSDLNWTLHGFSKNILILTKKKNIKILNKALHGAFCLTDPPFQYMYFSFYERDASSQNIIETIFKSTKM